MELFEYIRSLRPKLCLYAFLGVLVFAWHLAGKIGYECMLAGAVLACLTSAIMAWNDYFDRHHDVKKNRTLASDNPKTFLAYATTWWIISLLGIVAVYRNNTQAGWVLVGLAVLGWLYGWFRSVPILSGIVVAVSFGALVPLGAAYSPNASWQDVVLLTVCVMLFAFGRETIADLDDVAIDRGYKRTLPVVFGADVAKVVVVIATLVAVGLGVTVSPWVVILFPFTAGAIWPIARDAARGAKTTLFYDLQTVGFMVVLVMSA